MRNSGKFLPTLVLSLASAIVSIGPGRAAAITYTLQATATGSLDGVAYTDASIVLTMHNDTTNVVSGPPENGFPTFSNTGTLTVSVGGGPLETFTDPGTNVFVQQSLGTLGPVVGFDGGLENLAIGTISEAFIHYDLKTSIGPISGSVLSNFGLPFPTSSGPFVIDSSGDTTFTAEVAEVVPEPSSWMLLAIGFAGLGLVRRRGLLRGSTAG